MKIINSRDVSLLRTDLRPLYDKWLQGCLANGLVVMVTSIARSYLVQIALFAQGREPLARVNELRKIAGLYLFKDPEENKNVVTWTLNSRHVINTDDTNPFNDFATAWDYCIMRKGQVLWDVKADTNANDRSDYYEAGVIAESLGLEWGGRWSKPDYPHIQSKS